MKNVLWQKIVGWWLERCRNIERMSKVAKAVPLGVALAVLSGAVSAKPVERDCFRVLQENQDIPEARYLEVVKDRSQDYRLRECAGDQYAIQHPESVSEFIKLLFDSDRSTVQIAIHSLGMMGPPARAAVPFLIENNNLDRYDVSTSFALVNIGVEDKASLDKLLDMAIKGHDSSAIKVLARQKTLPAYVGEAVIAELDAVKSSEKGVLPAIANILIPVRTPKAIERYVELTNRFMTHPCCGIRDRFDLFKSDFQQIGTACIPALVNNFRKQDDLDSKTFSIVMLLGLGETESIEIAGRLGKEMLSPLLEDLAAAKTSVELGNKRLMESSQRILYLGPMVKPVGRELLILLEQASEAQMRRSLMWALGSIEYTDALPTIRRLASEERDAEVRQSAGEIVEALEKVLSKAKDSR